MRRIKALALTWALLASPLAVRKISFTDEEVVVPPTDGECLRPRTHHGVIKRREHFIPEMIQSAESI